MTEHTKNTNKGSARREHYNRGGTPAMWRGSCRVFTDKRKEESRNSCRRNSRNSEE